MTFGILASAHVPFASGASAYDTAVLADSPVLYYPLDESSGTTAGDDGSAAQDGTYTGSPTLGATGIGDGSSAVTLNGSSQYIVCPYDNFALTMRDFSVELWFKTSTTDAAAFCGTLNDGSNTALQLHINRNAAENAADVGAVGFYIRDEDATVRSGATTANTFNDGNWHHLVLTYDDDAVDVADAYRIYIDGNNETITDSSSGNRPDNFAAFGYDLLVGARNLRGTIDRHLNGTIAKFALYDYTLSSSDVSAHYAAA